MEIEEFALRLAMLRDSKGISARDMSLSLGQSAGYINGIETRKNFPSMTNFFYICEYLGITPAEFFDTQSHNPTKEKELIQAVKGLNTEQLESLIVIAKGLKK